MNRRPDALGRKLCRDSRRWTDFEEKRCVESRFFITRKHFSGDSSSRLPPIAISSKILHHGEPV